MNLREPAIPAGLPIPADLALPAGPGRPGLAVEVATWAPIEVVDVDGWSVGLSAGFTRRANSVVARSGPADPDAALDHAEALYAAYGLPPVVRVCADSRPDDLDGILERRGYRIVAPTSVMVAALGQGAPTTGVTSATSVTSTSEPSRAWLAGWLDVKTSTAGAVDLAVARGILCGSRAAYLMDEDTGGVAGVLRAAFADGWVGLSCLTVAPRARRRGVGRVLTIAALELARRRGADRAFLQVETSNTGAVALYRGLGFVVADRYHYRQR